MGNPLLYEINTRCWLRELSDRTGAAVTLANVPDSEFDGWARLGFTHLWLMGVWTTGPGSRALALAAEDMLPSYRDAVGNFNHADVAGSPYAIAEYRVPKALGGQEGLQSFRQRLHRRGLRLLLDFVPNHLGLDHPWVRERPELFVQCGEPGEGSFAQDTIHGPIWLAHGKDPHFPAWTDTAQLDYRNAETRAAMSDLLVHIASFCDGVRCDMAMLLLNDVCSKTWARFPQRGSILSGASREFWHDAIAATRRVQKDFLFLAEVYWGLEERLQSLGFDYTYHKELYDELVRRNPAGVKRQIEDKPLRFLQASAHFLENHDEPRIASLLSLAEHRAAALLVLSLPGMRLLHDGQLDGARRRLPVQFLRRCAEESQPDVRQMYDLLLTALKGSHVGNGSCAIVKPHAASGECLSAANMVLIQWSPTETSRPAAFTMVAVNLSPETSCCRAAVEFDGFGAKEWRIEDSLDPGGVAHRVRQSAEWLELELPPYGAQLLQLTAIG